jgi:hypothetical protein
LGEERDWRHAVTAHIAVSVEGGTEREFVKSILGPHLIRLGLTVKPVLLGGMGGDVSLGNIRNDLRTLIGNRGNTLVTTLYDFYGFRDRGSRTIEQLQDAIWELVSRDTRCLPYVQCYEFEALVFSGPLEAANILGDPNVASSMTEIVKQCGAPEQINDNKATCPSRRLKQLHPRYNKVLHGYRIIERIGLPKVRAACPRFHQWVTRLEALGAQP